MNNEKLNRLIDLMNETSALIEEINKENGLHVLRADLGDRGEMKVHIFNTPQFKKTFPDCDTRPIPGSARNVLEVEVDNVKIFTLENGRMEVTS